MAEKYQLKAILSAVDNMSPALKSISRVARSTRKYLSDVGSASGKLAGSIGLPLTVLSGALGGLSLVGLKNIVTGYTGMANSIKDGALQAGMSTAEFQRMSYVFDQNDVSVETMTNSMGKLNKNIAEAAAGKNAELAGLFNHLGISMRDANGQLRNGADILPALSDAFVRNKLAGVQARMGTAAFGKSYKELLPLLNEGSVGIAKSAARFGELKSVIADVDLDEADALNKRFKDLSVITSGFGNVISSTLVPVLGPLVERFIKWATANKEIIKTTLTKAITDLVEGLKKFDWKGFVENIKSMAKGFGTAVDMVGGAKNALIGFAIVMNANAIMATMGMIGALTRLVYWLGAMAIGLNVVKGKVIITGGIIAATNTMLGTSFIWLRTQALAALLVLRMGGVAGLATVAMQSIAAGVAMAGTALMGAGRAVMLFSRALLLSPLGIVLAIAAAAWAIYENWDTLKKWFVEFFDWIGEKWKAFIGWIGDAAKAVKKFFGGEDSVMTVAMQSDPQQAVSVKNQQQQAASRAPWAPVATQQQRMGGSIDVNFNNAPPGMRVEQTSAKGPLDMNLYAGYSGSALGMP